MMKDRAAVLERWRTLEPPYPKVTRHKFMAATVAAYAQRSERVLELGCNIGSNLLKLQDRGFHRLAGLDICPSALAAAQEQLGDDFQGFCGDLAEEIDSLVAAGPWGMVFSLATLMHVHPDSDAALRRIPELVGTHLITCEWERSGTLYIEPRDYQAVFGEALEQVAYTESLEVEGIVGYTLRVFRGVRR